MSIREDAACLLCSVTAAHVSGGPGGIDGGRKDKTCDVNVDPHKFQSAAQTPMDAVAQLWAQLIAPKAQAPQPAPAARPQEGLAQPQASPPQQETANPQ